MPLRIGIVVCFLLGCLNLPNPASFIRNHVHVEAKIVLKLKGIIPIATGTSVGAGTAISRRGDDTLVLTAAHVVANSEEVNIVCGQKRLPARHFRSDPVADLALLLVRDCDASITSVASHPAPLGSRVYTVGSPLYDLYGPLIADGVVASDEGPCVGTDGGCFLITNVTGPGSSGAPVLDERGNLVGIIHGMRLKQPWLGMAITLRVIKSFLAKSLQE